MKNMGPRANQRSAPNAGVASDAQTERDWPGTADLGGHRGQISTIDEICQMLRSDPVAPPRTRREEITIFA